jgi:hypothetical protein
LEMKRETLDPVRRELFDRDGSGVPLLFSGMHIEMPLALLLGEVSLESFRE